MNKILFTLLFFCSIAIGSGDASGLLDRYKDSVYQVRVINSNSGGRSSLGSGFLVSDGSLLATNYHVVSEAILDNKSYSVEVVNSLGEVESVSVERVDIVNDLVLLKRSVTEPSKVMPLAIRSPEAGEKIFSIGNPHDIGMTVIPATYNGLESHSFIEVVHFSGAINEGMSGGPVIDTKGDVVGINVATTANQISFLVPVKKLSDLLNIKPYSEDLKLGIQKQLLAHQQLYIDETLSYEWKEKNIGGATILGEISPYVSCWGDSEFDKKTRISTVAMGCSGKHQIYISDSLTTGNVDYEFWLAESETLSGVRFYNYVENRLENYLATNASSESVVSNFTCDNSFVTVGEQDISNVRASFCVRNYLDFPEVFDVFYVSSTYQESSKILISHFTLAGVSKGQASSFVNRFLGAARWL